LFEKSIKYGYDSEAFINAFMKSEAAYALDFPLNHFDFYGDEGVYEDILLEIAEGKDALLGQHTFAELIGGPYIKKSEDIWYDSLFWIGYTYRAWNILSNRPSAELIDLYSAKYMDFAYPGYHTLSVTGAVERIEEGLGLIAEGCEYRVRR
jgi:hypothetical protein